MASVSSMIYWFGVFLAGAALGGQVGFAVGVAFMNPFFLGIVGALAGGFGLLMLR